MRISLEEQTETLKPVLIKLKQYKIVVLKDREFCSVNLASWLRKKKLYFCLRLKKNNYVEHRS
jgi:hypothetical protein